jgi:hypothetical protein
MTIFGLKNQGPPEEQRRKRNRLRDRFIGRCDTRVMRRRPNREHLSSVKPCLLACLHVETKQGVGLPGEATAEGVDRVA